MSSFIGAEQHLIDLWVKARLVAQAVALEAISVGLSARIFNSYAPVGTPYPFIVYQAQVPPQDVRGIGIIRVMVEAEYVVKAVAKVDTLGPLQPLASLIDTALTEEDSQTLTGGFVFASVRQSQFHLTELEDAITFNHLGGTYLIQAAGSSG